MVMSRIIKIHKAPESVSQVDDDIIESLYEVSAKVYPRSVSGIFARWRVALVVVTQLIYYGLPWLAWNDRQAVLFDLAARKFYIFGLVLWPQDVIYLTVLLVISALSLFLFTAIAGRLFCGYACPQTVYTEIFMWVERVIEGDRPARMRLDSEPLSFRKLRIKSIKQLIWLAIACWTGLTFVGYFTPISTLIQDLKSFDLGPWQWFWISFYSFATWGNAGYMREQVCKHMCPYARFQSVMFDQDTWIISYDPARGEPRGSRSKKTDYKAAGLGTCTDCSICVQVCPTGIDIRKGLQYECIGCAACIDACDQVMEKMDYPKGLIRYSTERALTHRDATQTFHQPLVRPRIFIYAALLVVVSTLFVVSLFLRKPFRVDVIRDRATLAREVEDGYIENVYRLQVMNNSEQALALRVSVGGLATVSLSESETMLYLKPATNMLIPFKVRAKSDADKPGPHKIQFHFDTVGAGATVSRDEASVFILPE